MVAMEKDRVGEIETAVKHRKEEEPEAVRWPTREELTAARAYLAALHADVDRFMEETLREVEEDRKAGREQDPAEIDMDLWKKRKAKIIRDYPPPERLFPGVAAKYRKYLED
ncbi:hypothetical protein ACP70R_011279 [Stipagrostis hirtigluma subsp. patula]